MKKQHKVRERDGEKNGKFPSLKYWSKLSSSIFCFSMHSIKFN